MSKKDITQEARKIYESLQSFDKLKKSKDGKYPKIRCTESSYGKIYHIQVSKNKDLEYVHIYSNWGSVNVVKKPYNHLVQKRKQTWREKRKGITFESRCKCVEHNINDLMNALLLMPKLDKAMDTTTYIKLTKEIKEQNE